MYNFSFFIMDRLVSYASLLFMIELKKMKSKDNSFSYFLWEKCNLYCIHFLVKNYLFMETM